MKLLFTTIFRCFQKPLNFLWNIVVVTIATTHRFCNLLILISHSQSCYVFSHLDTFIPVMYSLHGLEVPIFGCYYANRTAL